MKLFLFTDLDRTVIPNGSEPESPQARPLLRQLARRPDVSLMYVSGRHAALIQQAIQQFDLPVPDYAIGDVGTTIYSTEEGRWQAWEPWTDEISPDWRGLERDELAALLADVDDLRLQEPEKQNRFKLSYYADKETDRDRLLAEVRRRLAPTGIKASLIWSIDEKAGVGLLDILPESATKLHAIRFLMQQRSIDQAEAVFAGDSGNDLPALTSDLQAVLVKNAREEVRREARQIAEQKGISDRLYFAQGEFLSMNGNYSAGVLEGVAHFLPETRQWMRLPE
jgi:sucrose-6F-phosphate phosphohydrolase